MKQIVAIIGIAILSSSSYAMQKGFLFKNKREAILRQLSETPVPEIAPQEDDSKRSSNYKNATSSIMTGEIILHMLKEGNLKPEPVPDIPQWPAGVSYKCRTVTLAEGPNKGEDAKIVSSLWALKGIDTIKSCPDIKHIFGGEQFYPLWKFYLDIDAMSQDGCAPLYYGKVVYSDKSDSGGCIIPESWLSEKDRINLYNFHRYELEVLGNQLFDPRSKSRSILLTKINNELERGHNDFMSKFLIEVKGTLASLPPDQCLKEVEKFTNLNKTITESRERNYPEEVEIKSIFLHAALLEAFKHHDIEIICNRKILYNSLAILKGDILKDASTRPGDRESRAILAHIEKFLPLAEVMRDSQQIKNLMYTDLLPRDIRLNVVRYGYQNQDTAIQ